MPYRQPAPAVGTQPAKKCDHSADSKDSHIPVGLHDQRDALPTPPLSIGQSEPNHVGHGNALDALDALKSSDYLKVRAALAKIDVRTLLDQIDKPKRPDWQTVLNDWISVKVPQPIFDKWDAERIHYWEHLHLEYDRTTETMFIRCSPSSIHESVPSPFLQQASMMMDRLSKEAKKSGRYRIY